MGIEINEPIILSDKKRYQCTEIKIDRIETESPVLTVTFLLKDANGKIVEVKKVEKSGAEYNQIYANWEGPIATRLIYSLIEGTPPPQDMPSSIENELLSAVKDSNEEE